MKVRRQKADNEVNSVKVKQQSSAKMAETGLLQLELTAHHCIQLVLRLARTRCSIPGLTPEFLTADPRWTQLRAC